MKKRILLEKRAYNQLLLHYKKSLSKLIRLRLAGKNMHRQNVLIKRIERLKARLEKKYLSIRNLRAASLLVGAIISTNSAEAQNQFRPDIGIQTNVTSNVSFARLVDLDGDGDLDIIQNDYGSQLQYAENIGTPNDYYFEEMGVPTFGLNAGTGVYLNSFAVGDLDGDGDFDILANESNYYGNNFYYFENTGSATNPNFAAPVTSPFGISTNGYYANIGLADIDNDGDLDLFEYNTYGGASLDYYENIGSSTAPNFASAVVNNPFGLTPGTSYSMPTFKDMDNDGDLDLFIGTSEYFENIGTAAVPNFATQISNPFSGISSQRVALGDLDGDNDLDAVLIDNSGSRYNLMLNNGTPTMMSWGAVETQENAFGIEFAAINTFGAGTFGDLDNDGDQDLLTGMGSGDFEYFENIGTTTAPDYTGGSITNPFGLTDQGTRNRPVLVDFDGDGDLDVVTSIEAATEQFYYFENTGTPNVPSFATAQPGNNIQLGNFGGNTRPCATFVDIDGDGDQDYFHSDNTPQIFFKENTGSSTNPNYSTVQVTPFNMDLSSLSPTGRTVMDFSDWDNDGDYDLLITTDLNDYIILENIGTATAPNFATPVINGLGLQNLQPAITSNNWGVSSFVDFDGDGDEEVFTWLHSGNSYYFDNTGAGGAPPVCTVTIPDANFKAYLVGNASINTNSNSEIECTEAAAYSGNINCQSLNISDLTGIEAFTSITALYFQNNQVSSLDISANQSLINLAGNNNQLTSIDLSNNPGLLSVALPGNQISSIDLSQNVNIWKLELTVNQLVSIDVSSLTALEEFYVHGNLLTSLDVSANSQLIDFACSSNNLTSLNAANGNNTNFTHFQASSNPNLTCIQVDDATYSTNNWTNIDSQTSFSESCSGSVSIDEQEVEVHIFPNPTEGLVTISSSAQIEYIEVIDMTGKVITYSISQTIDMSTINTGLYLIKVHTNDQLYTTTIIKN